VLVILRVKRLLYPQLVKRNKLSNAKQHSQIKDSAKA
jgi:hypothetical protein